MPGPARKPTKLKLLEGNRGHQRLNRREPEPTEGIPTRPEWLLPEAKREWRRVTVELSRLGLLTLVDRSALASYCQWWARYIEYDKVLTEKGSVMQIETNAGGIYEQQRPEFSLAIKSFEKAMSLSARFGFDPSSRSRIMVPQRTGADELDALLDGTG